MHAGAKMQIKITNHVVKLTPRLKERIEQRVGLALGRYADRIATVAVKFVEVKPRGQKRCRIDITLAKRVTVETEDADVFASVDRAVENATRRVAIAIELDDAATASGKAAR
jgi:ribosomal subunit interface protein